MNTKFDNIFTTTVSQFLLGKPLLFSISFELFFPIKLF